MRGPLKPVVFEQASSILAPNGWGGNEPIEVIEYANNLPEVASEGPPMLVVFAAGMLASRASHAPLLREIVRSGTERGRDVRVVTYEEPKHGGYESEQMERRLGSVLLAASVSYKEDEEVEMHVIGHSASASPAAHKIDALKERLPALAGFMSYTPTGDRERRWQPGKRKFLGLFGKTVGKHEARHRDLLDFFGVAVEELDELRHSFDPGWRGAAQAVKISFSLALEAFKRLRTPVTFVQAMAKSFYPDRQLTNCIENLNDAGVVTSVVIAEYDGANHYGSHFKDVVANGYQILRVLFGSSHLGGVTKPSNGAAIFDVLEESGKEHRQRRLAKAGHPANVGLLELSAVG